MIRGKRIYKGELCAHMGNRTEDTFEPRCYQVSSTKFTMEEKEYLEASLVL